MSPKAIVVAGPPGAGKGTQAQFIADHIGAVLYDTGGRIRERLARGEYLADGYEEAYAAGKLLDPKKTLEIVTQDVTDIFATRKSVVFSGSPRSIGEAFGFGNGGLMDLLKDTYGMDNILIFHLRIPVEESIKRNTKREGKRVDDTPKTIQTRYEEQYGQSVAPTIEEIQKRGFNVIDIDGMPSPPEVFESIKKYL